MPDLKTTFDADRTMRTETPAPAVAPYPGLSPDLIASLLTRQGGTSDAPARQRSRPEPRFREEPAPTYRPQMATAAPAAKKQVSRWIPDPFANPYQLMATGQKPGTIQERFIPGVGWEFDGAGIASRGSGGGPGRIDFSQTDQPSSPGLDPRMRALVVQQAMARGF